PMYHALVCTHLCTKLVLCTTLCANPVVCTNPCARPALYQRLSRAPAACPWSARSAALRVAPGWLRSPGALGRPGWLCPRGSPLPRLAAPARSEELRVGD